MNFFKPKQAAAPHPPPPHHILHQAFSSLQTHISNFLENLPTPPPIKSPPWARISNHSNGVNSTGFFFPNSNKNSSGTTSSKNYAMTADAIEERLAGVPVYALSNGSQEFVLVSGVNTGKNLGLFCFSESDAETLLNQMKSMDSSMRTGSQVVAVALSKIFQLKVDGVALRLIPEASQIQNAVMERKKAGVLDESFSGVPVFQSKSLILRSQNKRYRPVFFRKEDLEKSLLRASRQQHRLNPSLREGDIQVAVLEDIIRGMKDNSSSTWDDVVFVPPGFDVSTDTSKQ
ncbi:protein TIC 22-like, chloroplastic [Olea europaea var. sylvestris]|uniref:protein TIC 22-like, chloroplastic n=1 Tax=Olea europaea var. sylvestris TaxID=158386 RepID=UPI000C1CCD5D|nr:protein TIC 22-like, chloroplastic [Olea europaea var. sylvestris]